MDFRNAALILRDLFPKQPADCSDSPVCTRPGVSTSCWHSKIQLPEVQTQKVTEQPLGPGTATYESLSLSLDLFAVCTSGQMFLAKAQVWFKKNKSL